jgi:hypothetical protein
MIYSFIATSKQKQFIREYHVPSDFTLYDLKRFIDDDLEFDNTQPGMFFLIDDNGKRKESVSLFPINGGRTMDQVILDELTETGSAELHYTFDLFNNRFLTLQFIGETEKLPRTWYPVVALSEGPAPGQFSDMLFDEELASATDKITGDDDDDDEDDDDDDIIYDDYSDDYSE